MKQKLKYIIYFFTLICYLQAAFEVNNDYISNTWGDEYDTYISADAGVHFVLHIEQHNDLVFLPIFERQYNFTQIQLPSEKLVYFLQRGQQIQPYKIFLRHRELLI